DFLFLNACRSRFSNQSKTNRGPWATNVSRVVAPKFPPVLDGGLFVERGYLDAGSRPGVARSATDKLCVLAWTRRVHGHSSRLSLDPGWWRFRRSNRSQAPVDLHTGSSWLCRA